MERIEVLSRFVEELYSTADLIHKYINHPRYYGTDIKMTTVEIHTLAEIYRNEGLSVSELAEIKKKSISAITQMTNKLENKGLLIKKRNDEYHKVINLYTTDEAKRACKFHEEFDNINFVSILESLSDYDNDDLRKLTGIFEIVKSETNSRILKDDK